MIRIPEVFLEFESSILRVIHGTSHKKLGRDFHLIRSEAPASIGASEATKFVAWNLPVHHSWPCCPRTTPGFIEKAAQALVRKFGDTRLQCLRIGSLDPGASNRYYRTLASNLRGRALQIFPPGVSAIRDAEEQDARAPTLYCLIGKEGLYCGLQSPRECGGFYPGGTKFIRQNSPDTVSRAGAKIVEALHHLPLHRPVPAEGGHWLELGASPGGMTAELLARNYRVTAVDRAPLNPRLNGARGLRTVTCDAAIYQPETSVCFDAMLSDMNGDAHDAIFQVMRLSSHLKPGGLVIFTLKTSGAKTFAALNELEASIVALAATANLRAFATTHLTYNRLEFTLFFERQPLV